MNIILHFMSLKFKIYFPKFHIKFSVSNFPRFLKAKEFVSIEKHLFLVAFATKGMH